MVMNFTPEVIDVNELVNRLNDQLMNKSFAAFENWEVAKSNAYLDAARLLDETLNDLTEEARLRICQ